MPLATHIYPSATSSWSFFLPNTTSKLQPLHAGIITHVKALYKKCMLHNPSMRWNEISLPLLLRESRSFPSFSGLWPAVHHSWHYHWPTRSWLGGQCDWQVEKSTWSPIFQVHQPGKWWHHPFPIQFSWVSMQLMIMWTPTITNLTVCQHSESQSVR